MKTEDKLRVKLQDPAARAQLRAVKKKWGLNQSSYKSIRNLIRDAHQCHKIGKVYRGTADGTMTYATKACRRLHAGKYYVIKDGTKVRLDPQDEYDFDDEVLEITNNLGLPLHAGMILIDYLIYGKLNLKKPKIGIGMERNALKNERGRVLLYIDPDARLADVKKEWRKVRSIQKILLPEGRKNRSPKNMDVVLKSQKEKISKKKYRTLDVIDDAKKDRFDPRAAANARQMKYRYKKI